MSREEGRKPSATEIASHLACQHLTQLERQRRAGKLDAPFTPPRLEHESAYVERLQADGLRVVKLADNRDPAKTFAAMRGGADVIVQAALGSNEMRGIADILRRTEAPSDLGAYSYEPVDTKRAAETKAGKLLRLHVCAAARADAGAATAAATRRDTAQRGDVPH